MNFMSFIKSIITIIMFALGFFVFAQDVQIATGFLQNALSAAKESDKEGLVINLRRFQAYLDQDNVTPNKLSIEQSSLYAEVLYIASENEISVPIEMERKTIEFLSYKIESNPTKLFLLGNLYYFGRIVEKDNLKAIDYYMKASEQGNTKAMINLGNIYQESGNDREAVNWYIKAAERGESLAYENLISISLFGYKNASYAFYYAEAGTLNGCEKCMYFLAEFYKDGTGVKQDYTKAKLYYKKLCDNNVQIACEEYNELNN